jgi:NTE family protein
MSEKTALVLSAGGLFGAYQAGVWKALALEFKPDIVVGCSVGALNGWAIAGGCSPDDLIDQWLDPVTASLLAPHPKPGMRNGYFQSDALLRRAQSLYSMYRPKVPYGLILVQAPWLRTRLLQDQEVLPEHLLATCSIPFLFPAVRVGGGRFVDGGFLEILPLWAAAKMGATRAIAVHSLPGVAPWWLQAGMGFMRVFRPRKGVPKELQVTLISPRERMGTARDAIVWKRENIERWIQMGERDAERVFKGQAKACPTGLQ